MKRYGWFGVVTLAMVALGCDGGEVAPDGGVDTARDAGTPSDAGPPPSGAHPQYPALDLATLPGDGGGAAGPYRPPTLPATGRDVDVTTVGMAAGQELEAACATPGTHVRVPDTAGGIGVINLGNVEDCDVELGPQVVIDFLVVGSLRGPMYAPTHRVRIRGGQIGSMIVVGGSSDLVFDGVAINNGAHASMGRAGSAIYMPTGDEGLGVHRAVFVNSFIRMVAVSQGDSMGGCAFLGGGMRDVMFANNNVVTAGNNNSWGFRIGGGDNVLLIDNSVRVSFHKLVRLNDGPVDYVYVRGGTWMREATEGGGGYGPLNDSFAQLSGSTTDHIYVHDPQVYLLSPQPVSFGQTYEPEQAGRSWQARRIAWHAVGPDVISAGRLRDLESYCAPGADCDYGADTHSYDYDPGLAFPSDPWRDLPTFDDDNPDNLPVLP